MAAATGYSLVGPKQANQNAASANFTATLTPAGGTNAGVTITPSDGAGGGTFTPAVVVLSTGTPTATFTYTPLTTGLKTVSSTNNGGLTDPASLQIGVLSVARFTTTCVAALGQTNTGKAATLAFTVYDTTGAVLIPRTVGATTEIGTTGIYVARITLDGTWNGLIVWDDPSLAFNVVEPFDFVATLAANPGAAPAGFTRMRGNASQDYQTTDGRVYHTDGSGYVFVLTYHVAQMQGLGLVLA